MKVVAIFLLLIATSVSVETRSSEVEPLSKLNGLIEENQGKVIYLDFWASWCVPCRQSFPWLNQMQKKYESDGFVVIAVNLDEETINASKFLQKWPANFPVIYDSKGITASHYQLKGMPTSFILDRRGNIAVNHVGFFGSKLTDYEQQIVTLLKTQSLKKGASNES
ncbi:MAG: TlpA family protein disulfide reductase [Gammaproteobacteria bacterium]|nr:TlpA family protein disulfide reductase [Gammaproteobacteria bacterium]